jgi:hypothetical protein
LSYPATTGGAHTPNVENSISLRECWIACRRGRQPASPRRAIRILQNVESDTS